MEQERRASCRPGYEAFEAILAPDGRPDLERTFRTSSTCQDSGLLLRQYELPKGLPEDSRSLL